MYLSLSDRCASPQNPRHQTWKCRGNPSLTRGPSTLLALGMVMVMATSMLIVKNDNGDDDVVDGGDDGD